MSTSNTSNSYFLQLPKCNYLSETAVPVSKPSVADAFNVTSKEKAAFEAWEKTMKIWNTESAIIKQGIVSTLPDSLFLKIKGETVIGKMWKI